MNDNFVKMAKCRLCGKETNSILLNRRLKEIKDEDAFDFEPCDNCKKLLKTHYFFMGDCKHNGFIKKKALEKMLPKNIVEKIRKSHLIRMEKCPACITGQNINDFVKI